MVENSLVRNSARYTVKAEGWGLWELGSMRCEAEVSSEQRKHIVCSNANIKQLRKHKRSRGWHSPDDLGLRFHDFDSANL